MDTNKKVGPVVAGLVIALIIIIGGLYFFARDLNTNKDVTPTPTTETVIDTDTNSGANTDSAAAIEADIDSQLKDIDSSF